MKIVGIITRVAGGTIERGQFVGESWQQITVEGVRFFVPVDLQNGYCRGQQVSCVVAYKGDKPRLDEAGHVKSYEANFELLTIKVLPEVDLS